MTPQPPVDGRVLRPRDEESEEWVVEDLNVLRDDQGRIAIQFGAGVIHRDVRVRRAAPLTDPDHYLVFLDVHGRELCVVRDPHRLTAAALAVVTAALEHEYLSTQLTAIRSLRIEGEVCYVDAETSRGRRDFVVSNLQRGLRRAGDRKLLFIDIDGNRFEIEDYEWLDRRSVALLRKVL